MKSEVIGLSIFQQEVTADEGRTFLSCEGTLEDGTPVSFTVRDESSVYPVLTGTATAVKANALGNRAFLHKKESGGIILHGIEFTGENRAVVREGQGATTYHNVKFSRLECLAVPTAPKMQFKMVARTKVPQAQASA